MAQYTPPEWSAAGRNVFGIYLEVIKGGVVVESLQLPRRDGRSFAVAGRMETVCDLPLAHPSVSRVHAALQFDEQGALFLYDVGSTHGCFVNKRRVLAEEFVRLHIGDVLVFGESTRLYAVCGPPELLPAEYESLNLAKFREKLDRKREMQQQKKREEDRGASWGFGEDAEEEEEEEEDEDTAATSKEDLPDYLRNLKEEEDQPYKSSVSHSQVSEKDQRLYQQLQTRIRKMENLKLERSRILAKQNQLDGLSEGQQRTLDRNEQRIEALMKEIDDLEGRIHAKNDQRSKTGAASGTAARKKRNINEELYGYSSDEDDFYDRTKANQQKIAARKRKVTGSSTTPEMAVATTAARSQKSEVLTAESIQANVKKLEAELTKLQAELTTASAKAVGNQATSGESKDEEEADSLDSFMAATTTQLHASEVDTLMKRKTEVEVELKRQRQLLVVATPALAALPVQKPASKSAMEPVVTPSSSPARTPVSTSTAASPPGKVNVPEPVNAEAGSSEKNDAVSARQISSAEKKSTEDKPKARSARQVVAQKTADQDQLESSAPKRRRISGPTMGPPQQSKLSEQKGDDASVLEGGDQVWVPPTNQTGDGRTKLNDKYGY
ncbi:Anion exchanger adaptor protein Kanadaptin, contains FHA domain [Phytophthora cinnamomi]|uniref:Anion exchanger adaptor protein Kanadaptin, contains FHA domain n=1 Tax=Phytophthora cinnamomi TaxID=4785 RepID=UPI00355A6A2B|nr:Anion exchanger adaptor protein Kanadaptin, contains FHA domain [Phytophthora cinnamomi]